MLIELNREQIEFLAQIIDNRNDDTNILEALNNPIDISDTCPHCGCTEMLCGHNGSGCSHETDEEE